MLNFSVFCFCYFVFTVCYVWDCIEALAIQLKEYTN